MPLLGSHNSAVSSLVWGWFSECWRDKDQQGRAEEADHVESHWGANYFPYMTGEKETKLYASVAGWEDVFREGTELSSASSISDSDQKIHEMYDRTSLIQLFEHKSTDDQLAAAFWSLLHTVLHKSQSKQTPLLSTQASSGPVPSVSDKFMGPQWTKEGEQQTAWGGREGDWRLTCGGREERWRQKLNGGRFKWGHTATQSFWT